MEDRAYLVANKGITTRMSEAEALKLIQEVANEIDTFSLLSPSERSKIRLIKRLDNLQNDSDISIGISNKDTHLNLTIENRKLAFVAECTVTSRAIMMVSE